MVHDQNKTQTRKKRKAEIGTKGIIEVKVETRKKKKIQCFRRENGKCADAQQSDRIKQPGLRYGVSLEDGAVRHNHDRWLLGVGSRDLCDFSACLLYLSASAPIVSPSLKSAYLPSASLENLRQTQFLAAY